MRACAVAALGQLGDAVARHPDVLPALLAALHDPDEGVRQAATQALGQLGTPPPTTLMSSLLYWQVLHDADRWEFEREYAARVLGQLGDTAAHHPDVLPTLLDRALHDTAETVRARTVAALGQLGDTAAHHPDVLPTLLDRALHDTAETVRACAVAALGQLGDTAVHHPDVLPTLLDQALRNNAQTVHTCAVEALGQMGDTATTTPMSSLLCCGHYAMRVHGGRSTHERWMRWGSWGTPPPITPTSSLLCCRCCTVLEARVHGEGGWPGTRPKNPA